MTHLVLDKFKNERLALFSAQGKYPDVCILGYVEYEVLLSTAFEVYGLSNHLIKPVFSGEATLFGIPLFKNFQQPEGMTFGYK